MSEQPDSQQTDDSGNRISSHRTAVNPPGTRRRKRVRNMLIALGIVLTGFAVLCWKVGGLLIAAAPRHIGPPPDDLPCELFSCRGATDEDVVSGWMCVHPAHRATILLLHGIRSSRRAMLPRARMLYESGYSVVLIDLPAHGESSGDRITLGYDEGRAVQSVVDHLRTQRPDKALIVIGVSLGGAAALQASPLDIDGLVIESVFPDIDRAVTNRVRVLGGPAAPILSSLLLCQIRPRLGISRDQLRPVDHIRDINYPVLVMSGAEDPYTPPEEAQEIFDAAPPGRSLWIVDGAAHEDLYAASPEDYQLQLFPFLSTCAVR